jgi:4-hydroxy-3-polyprenylbenzoate decarboxylase
MAYRSFRQFLDALEQAGELKRVVIPVDTDLLIAEWADREMKSPGGGKALLFEQPIVDGKKSEFTVAINTMGSRRRMAMALQVSDVEDVAREIQLILKAKPPTDLREGWNLLKQGIHLLHARPKSVRDAPCQEVVHQSDIGGGFSLRDLPILKCWPKDGGRFITLPNVHTRDPETGVRNVGIYRMQVYDERTTGMHWQVHKVGARHGKRYYERGERMPVAVTLGGDPVYTFALCRCRTVWTNCCLPGSSAEDQSTWCGAKRSTWRCRQTLISFWKVICSQPRCARKGRLVIIPGFTPQSKTTPFSI